MALESPVVIASCPNCGRKVKTKREKIAGKRIRCTECGRVVELVEKGVDPAWQAEQDRAEAEAEETKQQEAEARATEKQQERQEAKEVRAAETWYMQDKDGMLFSRTALAFSIVCKIYGFFVMFAALLLGLALGRITNGAAGVFAGVSVFLSGIAIACAGDLVKYGARLFARGQLAAEATAGED